MKALIILMASVFVLSGCVVRTYQVTKDRVDQDLSMGNRGYLKGQAPAGEEKERKATRSTQVVEVELRSPIKFEKMSKGKAVKKTEEQPLLSSQESAANEIIEPGYAVERYTVQKGDTLQKISQKYFGTTKKWTKIFEANKDKLKTPDRIRPGQVIDIPVEQLKETKENLK